MNTSTLYRILLVENDAGDADLVRQTLRAAKQAEFEVSWVTTLSEALQKLPTQPYDAVLLDHVLPDSMGLDTIHAVRLADDILPIVVLTGHDDIEFALQIINAGAQDYLIKGKFDRETLVRAIRYAISRAHRQKKPLKRKRGESYQQLATRVFEAMGDGIMVTDAAANIEAINPAFCRITGYSENEVIGKNSRILKSDHHDQAFHQAVWNSLQTYGEWSGEIWNRRKSGEVYPEWQNISCIRDETGKISHYIAVFSDMSNAHPSRPAMNMFTWNDPLTGLANRAHFLRQIERNLALARTEARLAIVMLLDLDRFKDINEARSPAVGNNLLKKIAKTLSKGLHSDDVLARLDSDEFAILLPRLFDTHDLAEKDAMVVAEKLRTLLRENIELNGESFHINASIGIVIFPELPNDSASDILRQADMAMHRAKAEGGGRAVFFKVVMGETIKERYRVERELRQAIIGSQLRLYVQPQLESGITLVGAEALVRWEHPERSMVLPSKFIPLAETTDLIVAVDRWVLEAVCRLLGKLNRDGHTLSISVNISPRHFQQADFVDEIKRQLAVNVANPSHLVLEVTEGLIINDFPDVVAKISMLRTLGVHFSMDDFGTGYSSLAYLKRLPIHELKIDRSFIQDITTNPNDAALVESILAVAQHLHLQVVAEGVETEAQAEFLNSHGKVIHQGYLYGRPLPADKWVEQLERAES